MIQSVITRLSAQSTTVKGWCVTLNAALLGFGASTTRSAVALIAVYVILAFAVLDAYYLALERNYRGLYNKAYRGEVDVWTMLVPRPTLREFTSALFSAAVAILYGASLLTAITVAIYVRLM